MLAQYKEEYHHTKKNNNTFKFMNEVDTKLVYFTYDILPSNVYGVSYLYIQICRYVRIEKICHRAFCSKIGPAPNRDSVVDSN